MISALVAVTLLPLTRCLVCTKHADQYNNSAPATIVSFSGGGKLNPWRHLGWLAWPACLTCVYNQQTNILERGRNSETGNELMIRHYLTLELLFILFFLWFFPHDNCQLRFLIEAS